MKFHRNHWKIKKNIKNVEKHVKCHENPETRTTKYSKAWNVMKIIINQRKTWTGIEKTSKNKKRKKVWKIVGRSWKARTAGLEPHLAPRKAETTGQRVLARP